MKTAISIPDDLFKTADKIAKKLGQSRSEFYSGAIREYVQKQRVSDVTQILNNLYGEQPSGLEGDVMALQNRNLQKNTGKESW